MYKFFSILAVSSTLVFSNSLENTNNDKNYLDYNKAEEFYKNGKYEKAYIILKKIFLNDLTNKDINFSLAKTATKLKKYGIAQAAYERILIIDPSNNKAKFEQSKLMYIVGDKKQSEINLKKQLSKDDLPKDLKSSVNDYLKYIDDNKKLIDVDLTMLFEVNYSDNATVSPEEKYILPDYNYLGYMGDDKVDDVNFLHLYNINISKKFLKNEHIKLKNSFTYFDKRYKDEKDENFEYYSYKPSLQMYKQGNIYSIATGFSRYQPGYKSNENYFESLNISSSIDNRNYSLLLNAQRFFYRKDENKEKNYTSYQTRFRLNNLFGFTFSTIFAKDVKFKSKRTDIDKIYLDSSISYKHKLNKISSLEPKFRYKIMNYNDENIFFNSKRKDRLKEYSLKLMNKIDKSSYLNFNTSYLDNSSNQNEYKYNNTSVSFSYIKRFTLY